MVLVFLRNFTQNVKKATGTETKIFFVAKDRKDYGKNRNIRWKQNQSVGDFRSSSFKFCFDERGTGKVIFNRTTSTHVATRVNIEDLKLENFC